MRTKGKALRDKFDDSVKEIDRLLAVSHTEEQYAQLFKITGGEVEKFLKATVFQTSANKNFHDLIEDLKGIGIAQQHIDALHLFRDTYNGYKHRPGFSKSILDAKKIFVAAGAAIDDINGRGIGAVNHPYVVRSNRVVWFAGWDDYVGGMTECDIFIPDYSVDFPVGLEHFNITFDGWEEVIKKFTASGDLKMGKEYVSERAYNVWRANTDLMGVGAFNGDVAEFVRELAKYSSPREKELLSFLKRENDTTSVRAAIVFSLFDSMRENSWKDKDDLKSELLLRSSYDYGIEINSAPLIAFIEHINFPIVIELRETLKNANEIIWTDKEGYEKQNVRVLSERLHIGMTAHGDILIKVR